MLMFDYYYFSEMNIFELLKPYILLVFVLFYPYFNACRYSMSTLCFYSLKVEILIIHPIYCTKPFTYIIVQITVEDFISLTVF